MMLFSFSRRGAFAAATATLVAPLAMCGFLLTFVPGIVAPAKADLSNPALQMALGNPDKATSAQSNTAHYLISRPQYAESYNDTLHFPNWVSWHLSRDDVGGVDRGQFKPDPELPDSFVRVTPADYTNSGYDRGHNCPSKDRTATRSDNDAVFLMSNMTPQAHGMNAGPWEDLEAYSRELAGQGNELFITCGHGFSQPTHQTIGRAQVAVPDFGWKIVVVVPPGSGPALRRITPTTRVIAVRMPNINTVSKNQWRTYRTSVADIEQATGLVFFDKLPRATARALKNRVDFDRSAPPRQRTTASKRHQKPSRKAAASHPLSAAAQASIASPAGVAAQGQVWVNTKSKAYWKPGTLYYGKTKKGKYMSETDAIKAGYHAAEDQ